MWTAEEQLAFERCKNEWVIAISLPHPSVGADVALYIDNPDTVVDAAFQQAFKEKPHTLS